MSISSVIRRIGRGVKGASDLSQEEAQLVFQKILSKEVSQIELGAFCIAMRMKGETALELAGFMDAVSGQMKPLHRADQSSRTIVLPSYNGSRKNTNLTPLLAMQLTKLGFLVIVQGVRSDPDRVTTFEIFQQLDWPILVDLSSQTIVDQTLPYFLPLASVCPALQEVLDIRRQLGLRNSGHLLAKLINPAPNNAWQIVNYTHPEYPKILEQYFAIRPSHLVLMRGHEGEPTCSLTRLPEMIFFKDGGQVSKTEEFRFADAQNLSGLDVSSHVELMRRVIHGQEKMPDAVIKQAELLSIHCVQ
jgi:anthranilate phosphoribosyltransferase